MKNHERAGLALLFFWLLIVLGNLAFWGAVIYIAVHFLSKFW